MLAMDRVAAAGSGGGRGGAQDRSFGGNSRRGAPQGYAAQAADEGYAARAAPSSGGKGRELDDGGRDSSSRNRGEFKEYALAVRKRDRRGRVDEQPDPRERVGGRSHRGKDYSQVRRVLGVGSRFAECVFF